MRRVSDQRTVEVFDAALEAYPISLRRYLEFDLFTADPIFAGISHYESDRISDGRLWRETAHVCYHIPGLDTIVVPKPIPVAMAVHELAHVLDHALDFKIDVAPVDEYASRNRSEAFAEFITTMFVPGYLWWDVRAESVWQQYSPVRELAARL
jgi:hypothetical protein